MTIQTTPLMDLIGQDGKVVLPSAIPATMIAALTSLIPRINQLNMMDGARADEMTGRMDSALITEVALSLIHI